MSDTVQKTTRVTRDGDVWIGGKSVGSVIREPSFPPPNWGVVDGMGCIVSWHYLRRDAVKEIERRHTNGR